MVAQGGGGRIVNVTSVVDAAADRGARPPTCTAKGGILGADEDAGGRARPARHHGQRPLPGRDRHAAEPDGLHAAGAAQLRGAHPARPHRGARGDRRRDRLPRASDASRYVNGVELVVRRRVRPQRQRRARANLERRSDGSSATRSDPGDPDAVHRGRRRGRRRRASPRRAPRRRRRRPRDHDHRRDGRVPAPLARGATAA